METTLIFLGVLAAILFFLWIIPIGLYYQCKVYQIDLDILNIVLMRWRRVPPGLIVSSLIKAKKEGIDLNPVYLEVYYLAGGNVFDLTEAAIYAKLKNTDIELKQLMNANLIQKDLKSLIDRHLENKKLYGDSFTFGQ